MINVKSFVFNPFQENTYILSDDSGECIVIDPGCYEAWEKKELKDYIAAEGLKVVALVHTHCHIDHFLGSAFVKETYHVPVLFHANEAQVMLASVAIYGQGFPGLQAVPADRHIDDGDTISFGHSSLQVLAVPGHSPGHVAFYSAADKFCIGGDVLFKGSIGNTSLPGASFPVLEASIRNKMYQLPDDTTVYCGHYEPTTIGHEKRHNPFVRAK